MSYQVIVRPAARRQFKKLLLAVQKKLIALIEQLGEEPRPLGCKKLKGRQDQYRVRFSDYRIIYSVDDESLLIQVIKAGHR